MRHWFFGFLCILLTAFFPLSAQSHGGGLDSLGCHHNRKAGGYHCHRGPLAGQSFSSKSEALQALKAKQGDKESQKGQDEVQKDQNDRQEQTVYVTRSGTKYHGPNCSYLRRSKIPLSLKEAREKGYTPCSRCKGR